MRQEGPKFYYTAERTIYVAKDGNDAFNGTNRAQAVQTVTQALVLAAALSPGAGTAVGIQIMDAGVYTEDLAIPDYVLIQGRQAALVGNHTSGGGCFIDVGSMIASSGTVLSKNSSTSNTAVICPFVLCSGSANGFLCTIGDLKVILGSIQVEDGYGIGQTTSSTIKGTFNSIDVTGSGIGVGLGSAGILELTGNSIEVTGTGTGVYCSTGGAVYLNVGRVNGGASGTAINVLASSSLYIQAPVVDGDILVASSGRLEINENSSNYNANERSGFVHDEGLPIDDGGNALAISVDAGTRTLTLAPTASTYTFYSRNSPHTITGNDTVTWTDVEGAHFFYYPANSTTLTHTTTFSESFIYGPDVFVAFLIWDATNGEVILDNATVELHGITMSGATHSHFHNVLGAQWISGLALNTISADQSGAADSHAQFGVDSGVIADEDLRFATPSIGSTTGLRMLYLDGAAANVRQDTETGFSVLTDVTAGIGATGRLVYNQFTGGSWQLTTVSNNDYVLCHVFSVGSATSANRVYAAIGQNDYATVVAARDGAETELASLVSALPFPEIRPIATLIFQTADAYGNSVKARIRSVSGGGDYIDWRQDSIPGGSTFTPTDHNSLAGRTDAGAHSPLTAPTAADQVIQLADAAGTYALSIQDSGGVEVADIDSDGNATVSSLSVASAVDITGTLTVDTINEHTAANGVTIDGVDLKDNGVVATATSRIADLTLAANRINEQQTDTDAASIDLNYVGYQGGTTRFRDLTFYDGKQGQIALFDGSAGVLEFASGKGISFGDETLQDYDEGTWTPTEANVTVTSNSGRYIRIGNMVFITGTMTWPSTSDSNAVLIQGLPFASINGGGEARGGIGVTFSGTGSGINIQVIVNSTTMNLGSFSATALTNANMSATTLRFGGCYEAQ